MYLPRPLISKLYKHLSITNHPLSPPLLIFVALEPDALCACRILTALLKRDYIAHKIQPISGYDDLERAGRTMVLPMRVQNGGAGGVVVCLGVGALVDMSEMLGLLSAGEGADDEENPYGGVEVWLIDARRPWNVGNVFSGNPLEVVSDEANRGGPAASRSGEVLKGQIQPSYKPGLGGVIVYDDGDVEEDLAAEGEAYLALMEMGDVGDLDDDSDDSDAEVVLDDEQEDNHVGATGEARSKKRKSRSDQEDEDEDDDGRPRQRRRSNSNESIASSDQRSHGDRQNQSVSATSSPRHRSPSSPVQPSARALRRQFKRDRKKHMKVLDKYYNLGATYSEPISSIIYSLAEDLGREDNDLLWQAIVGVSSLELYGRSMTGVGISTALDSGGSAGWGGERGERIRQALRDEVRRLNPPDPSDIRGETARGESSGVIPTTARSPTDHSIRLSPEPRFLLIRHWSLYDSMLHSPYLGSRLHIWNDVGRKRLHKLLAKMGVSLSQCKQSYTHMDMDLKRGLRQRLLTYAPMYGLVGLVPPPASRGSDRVGWGFVRSWGWKACLSAMDVGVIVGAILEVGKSGARTDDVHHRNWQANGAEKRELVDEDGTLEGEEWVQRFWEAYDALDNIEALKLALPTAQHLHRAILRTGTSLIEKRQIRHLKAFRMAVVKEGPDVALFTHPAALTKLALWVGEAIAEQEREQRGKVGKNGKNTPLVLAGLNEARGVYVVVGTGGGGGVIDFAQRAKRKQKIEEKAKAKEAKRLAKEQERREKEERRGAENGERTADGDEEDDEEEEEEDDDDDSDDDDSDDDDDERSIGKNRFGLAFQKVIAETNARVRIDSFENCVVEVKKEDLSGFLEGLSMKAVVG